ncbi:RICIN domain-containing protein [Streptomyces sp. NPDC052727]|uniref:RICIN domain-containing protein n=1 Tax=Streptomyces sp. NPDC052727 TaxID=3154854 RepID=UPI00344A989C
MAGGLAAAGLAALSLTMMNTGNSRETVGGPAAAQSTRLHGERATADSVGRGDEETEGPSEVVVDESAATSPSATGHPRRKPAGTAGVDGKKDAGARKKSQAGEKTEPSEAAPRWEETARRMSNAHSGKCLTADDGRAVVQGPCDTTNAWQRLKVDDGVFLVRSVRTGTCLDSNGEAMYVSPCTDDDTGQLWRMPSAGGCSVTLTSRQYGKYVTGWNTGTVSLVSAETADTPDKYTWSVSPSEPGGC